MIKEIKFWKPSYFHWSILENWSFNSCSRGCHKYMNICVPLTGDESLICRKKRKCVWFEETLSLDMSPKIYVASFGNVYLRLAHHQYVLWVKVSTVVLSMLSKFLSAFFPQGHVKEVEWIKDKIEEAENKVQAHFEKCMKNAVYKCFLLLLHYYLYKQNISYWILCFYLPFSLLKSIIKTKKQKNPEKPALHKWFSTLGIKSSPF